MPKSEDNVSSLIGLRIIVSRSNPMIMREIIMRDSYTADELIDTVCISLGIPVTQGDLKCTHTGADTIKDLFTDSDSVELLLPKNSGKNARSQLCIYIDRMDDKGASEDIPAAPQIVAATKYNLPNDQWDIRDIDLILMNLDMYLSYTFANKLYYARDLEYIPKRTQNAMRRRFAPETAEKEVNPVIKLPMRQILSGSKLDVLKDICERYGAYYYSGMRKADIVERLCNFFDRQKIWQIITNMNIYEYNAFRDYLLDENVTRLDKDIENILYMFCDRGLITFMAPAGYCIAAEVAELFEEIYGTVKEEKFVKEKYVSTAVNVCALLYGVFDYDMFNSVLNVINEKCLSDNEKKAAFNTISGSIGEHYITSMPGGYYCYNPHSFKQKVIGDIVARRGSSKEYFIPDETYIKTILRNGMELSGSSRDTLAQTIVKYRYYSYYNNDISQILDDVIESIHWGESTQDTWLIMERNLYKLVHWESKDTLLRVKAQVIKLIEKEAKYMPLVGLGGYSLNNAPKEMKNEYLRIKEEQEEAARSASEKKKAGNVKRTKAVPVTRRRY